MFTHYLEKEFGLYSLYLRTKLSMIGDLRRIFLKSLEMTPQSNIDWCPLCDSRRVAPYLKVNTTTGSGLATD